MVANSFIRQSGYLDVGDGHKIYYEDWGNPDGFPIMHFHGGPGAGFNDSHKLLYDPDKHHVIFFDQRGAGKSTPFAEIKDNTTQKLIDDTEGLRIHLGIEKMHLVGGSWGSTMALCYAIAYPERVNSIVLWAIYLASQFENDFVAGGYAKYTYPEAWERFIKLVPQAKRSNGNSITKYYSDKLQSDDETVVKQHADEWALWETSLLTLNYDQKRIEQEVVGDSNNIPLSRLETHYFLNGCFISDNYILEKISTINQLPCYVVQGRFDNCTPPSTAYKLSKAYGSNLTLQIVNAGHKRTEPKLLAALRKVIAIKLT